MQHVVFRRRRRNLYHRFVVWSRQKASDRDASIRDLVAPFVKAERRRLILLSVTSILGGFAEAGTLVLIARTAFALASNSSDVKVNVGPVHATIAVPALIGAAGVLVVIRIVIQGAQSVLGARVTYTTVNRVRKRLVHLYLGAGWPLQASQREGRLQELLTTYAGATATAVGTFSGLIAAGFNLAALLVTALVVNALASIVAGLAALLIGLLLRPLRAAVRRRSARSAAANLEFATGLTEFAATLQETRIFQVENQVGARLDTLTDRSTGRALSTAYVSQAISVLYQGIAMLLIVSALGVAYAAGFSRLASLGAIVLIMLRSLTYAQGVQGAIQGLYESAPYLETLRAEEVRYRGAAVRRDGDPIDRIGEIAFDDVSFAYEPGLPVLRHVSFRVPQGEIVGVVGPSGAGKSTLVQLVLRLREPTSGAVLANGRDVRELSLDDWYGRVTFVPQEARLFAGTVADNIRFFRHDVDDTAVERAAKLAHLHEEISSWPLGYDTPVGERGGQLSGGQRQRLCIARALAEDPDIMVLDEPTSSLDVKSESLIRETVADLGPTATVFVIAHRLSTLAICNRIMVILGGQLQGFDEPDRLEEANPFYREALQLAGMRS
jgi:ABC-type multidrug transport system fused ATPase/permease subunit